MSKKSHFLLGFVLGAASSLAATYLLTPQTSEDLKKKFNDKKDDLADRAADYYDYAREATAEWRDSATTFVDDLKQKAKKPAAETTYDDATAALRDKLTETPEVATDDDFDDIVLDGKSAFAQAKDQTQPAAEPATPAAPVAPAEPEEPEDEPEDQPED